MQAVLANVAVSVSDLKRSPTGVLSEAQGETVAILNHNRVMAYMVPPAAYEAMMELIDDAELATVIRARSDEVPVKVGLDEL
ncbi:MULTISPECIES: type II toxin-antitoxin system Phd/YefM family antitoxin [Methylobacterium]|uniref:type II toxin-antitoxin system Phd/YefM family antitoxin n=1 Tax=Methylobacterium TaxID=407 RepID=UPI0002697C76|nr:MULTISPECIES: type II toxin-antitoxin system Phd/YefM family antitoxin [Methylobacterium]AYO81402.1 antitoxin [Methylobacterium brachiatum]EIZ85010.1 prevent-host-death family protein [Methylobacterium sp. GXF4]